MRATGASDASPVSTPEHAVGLLMEKAQLVFGDQSWGEWQFETREFATREPRTIRFRYEGGIFVRT